MLLGFISDLHYDVNFHILQERRPFARDDVDITITGMVRDTIKLINSKELDYLFISGDLMNSVEGIDIVEELNKSCAKVYYVPGNHDIWSRVRNAELALNEHKKSGYCLVDKILELNENWAVVGMFSWYDGSMETLGKGTAYYDQLKSMWADANYALWDDTNVAVAQKFTEKTSEVLKTIDYENIILLNHFVPSKEFIVHKYHDPDWNFGNGFMGTERILELVQQDKRIRYLTFGHTHEHYGMVNGHGVKFISAPVGYVGEWQHDTFRTELERSLIVLEV